MKMYLVIGLILLGSLKIFAANEHLIAVSGAAEKSLDPNMLNMIIEVWSKAGTAKEAQQLAANQYRDLKKTFESFKIKKEDIQTENYSLNPEYEYDQKLRQNKMIGFRVAQSLMVTVRKVDDAGNFLDAIVKEKGTRDSGINLNSLSWDSDKRSQAEVDSLAGAVKAAQVRAEEIAKAAGVKIKGVYRISHSSPLPGPEYGRARVMSAMMETAGGGAPTELSVGQVKVRVEVSAEYEIY